MNKLRDLEIKSGTIISSENFRLLFDNTPYLYSSIAEKGILQTLTENWSNRFICSHLSYKIRSLKLKSTINRSRCLSRNDLQQIFCLQMSTFIITRSITKVYNWFDFTKYVSTTEFTCQYYWKR